MCVKIKLVLKNIYISASAALLVLGAAGPLGELMYI
jgi:hypothetical protein